MAQSIDPPLPEVDALLREVRELQELANGWGVPDPEQAFSGDVLIHRLGVALCQLADALQRVTEELSRLRLVEVAHNDLYAVARELPPPLWQHAVSECNEAHQALDKAGAPTTTRVRRVRGPEGEQDVTIGLADRVRALISQLRAAHVSDADKEH